MNSSVPPEHSRGLACIVPLEGRAENAGPVSSATESIPCGDTTVTIAGEAASDDGLVAAIAGCPRWPDAELRDRARESGNATALLEAYRRWGGDTPEKLTGAFALVVVDSPARRIVAAVDKLGQQPLYYLFRQGTAYLASRPDVLQATGEIPGRLRTQAIYDYLYFHMVPSPGSIYEDIRKLPAAHRLEIGPEGVATERYWKPGFRSTLPGGKDSLHRELRALLKASVRRALPADGPVATFLSGGLDSSTVAGMLSEISEGQVAAYTIGFAAEGYDEIPYARITARHFGLKLHEYYVTPDDVVSALPTIATAFGEPFGNSSALPAWFCARRAASDGITHMLAGDGGDELFAGNERYAKQGIFERYLALPQWLRGTVETVVGALPDKLPLSGKARSFIAQARTPLPDRLQTYNFLHQHAASEVFSPEFLQQVRTEAPLELLRDTYTDTAGASAVDRMLYLDWQYTLADNDLRKVSDMCALAGVDVSYPMLDDELLEFSTRLPGSAKLPGRKLRHFYKQGLRDWLPRETLTKSKHGFGLPFGVWMREHEALQTLAYDNIVRLKRCGWFNPAFLDETIRLHREGHASYYGELVWVLMILALWMDHRGECPE